MRSSAAAAAALAVDVMVRAPKVHAPSLTVAELRVALADDHVHMLLLVDEGRLVGTAERGDVPPDADGSEPVLPFARTPGRTVAPDAPVDDVRTAMLARGARRLAVVDGAGRLLGLLCLKRHLDGFCSDADVAARAADRHRCP
jgi:CBS domain-containing protein